MKRRAALSIVPHADVASVRLDDGATDGYPKPHSVGFRCKERLKQMFPDLLAHPDARVGNRQLHIFPVRQPERVLTARFPGMTPNAHVVLTLRSPTSYSMSVSVLGSTLTEVTLRKR